MNDRRVSTKPIALVVSLFTILSAIILAAPPSAAAQTWTPAGAMSAPRIWSVGFLLPDGTVLVAAGLGSTSCDTGGCTTDVYNPATGAWSPGPPTVYPHTDLPAGVRLADGRFLLTGGRVAAGSLNYAEIFDPATNLWQATGPMQVGRVGHTLTLLPDGRVLAAGGYSGGFVSSAEIYDPAAGTWTPTGGMANGKWLHTATLLSDGRVLVTGGENYGDPIGPHFRTTEFYNPASTTWTLGPMLATGRAAHSAAVLPGGRVMVAGGLNGFSVNPAIASSEIFDGNAWGFGPSLAVPRWLFTLTSLNDGTVLAAGGVTLGGNPQSITAAAERYSPATNAWTAMPSMNFARTSHSATRLADGRVLVAGGYSNNPSGPQNSWGHAEIFSPQSDFAPPVTTATSSIPPNGNGWNNQGVVVTLHANDMGGSGVASMTYSVSGGLNGGATINTDTLTFQVGNNGDTTFVFHATDRAGNVAPPRTFTVRMDQLAPVLNGAPPIEVRTNGDGANVAFTRTAVDAHSGVVSVTSNPPSGSFFPIGFTPITVTARDAAGNTTIGVIGGVNVIRNNTPMFVPPTPSGGLNLQVGQTLTFTVRAQDSDAGDVVTLAATGGLPASAVTTNSGPANPATMTVTWTPGPMETGGRQITFTASDNLGGFTNQSVFIQVNQNNPPFFSAGPFSVSVQAGSQVSFTLTAADPDNGEPVTLAIDPATKPVTATTSTNGPANPVNLTFTWTPTSADVGVGPRTVRFTATDSRGAQAFRTVNITVTAPPLILQSIRVQPALMTVSTGTPIQYQAIGRFSDGSDRVLPNGSGGGQSVPGAEKWHVRMAPGLNVNQCTAVPISGGGLTDMGFSPAADGTVHTQWGQNSSGNGSIVSVDGSLTAANVSLALACSSQNGATGSLTAAWTGTRYEGTATFGGSTVTASITGWSSKAPMPTARFSLAAESANGIVYAIGGAIPNALLNVVEAYDPATNTWSTKAPMPTPREGARAALLNGLIYVAGGHTAGGVASGVLEAYDPATNTWVTGLTPMPTARAAHAMVAAAGKLYAIGGEPGPANTPPSAVVEAYDPSTNSWTARAPLPLARKFFTAGVLNGGSTIVVAGGVASGVTAKYDVASNVWTPGPSMLNGGLSGMASGVASNAMFVVGSVAPNGLQLNHMYRPSGSVFTGGEGWSSMAYMPTGRGQLGAAMVGNVLYAIGGLVPGSGSVMATLEAFSTPPPDGFQTSQGNAQSNALPPVTWSSSNPGVAGIGPNGSATAYAAGTTNIVASTGNVSCATTNTCGTLNVTAAYLTFTLAPGSATFTEMTVTVTDPDGETFTDQAPIGQTFDVDPGIYQVTITPPAGYTVTPVQFTLTIANGSNVVFPLFFALIDVTPPVISSVTPSTGVLWPPNHKMVSVALAVSVTDNVDASPSCSISSVSSNEPINGTGDGDTGPDWTITGPRSVDLRAERAGGGSGRVYTIAVSCSDANGNIATKSTTVTVAHDQGKK